jgi:hypothetical protein
MMNVNLQPLYELYTEHPVASVLTLLFCLAVSIVGIAFCIGVLTYKDK